MHADAGTWYFVLARNDAAEEGVRDASTAEVHVEAVNEGRALAAVRGWPRRVADVGVPGPRADARRRQPRPGGRVAARRRPALLPLRRPLRHADAVPTLGLGV